MRVCHLQRHGARRQAHQTWRLARNQPTFARRLMAARRVAVARRPAAGLAKAVPGSAAAAKAQRFVESVRLAAQYKRESDPLSVPSGDLKEKTKRTVYGDLAQLVHLLAEASSSGENPLCKASATQDGAFVAVNHRAELTGWQGSYLFLCAIAFLHRVELPPLHEYCAKKSETTTPWRWAQEELRLYDPAARTYCAVHALIEALQAHFGFQLGRLQMHTTFLYSTSSKAGLVAIELDALLAELKAQLPLPKMPGLTQHSTVAQMCDMLLKPFKKLFVDARQDFRDDLDAIDHAPRAWDKWAAKLGSSRKEINARKALINRLKAAAKVVRKEALRNEAAAKPPSRSGKRKAPTAKKGKKGKQAKAAPRYEEVDELSDNDASDCEDDKAGRETDDEADDGKAFDCCAPFMDDAACCMPEAEAEDAEFERFLNELIVDPVELMGC